MSVRSSGWRRCVEPVVVGGAWRCVVAWLLVGQVVSSASAANDADASASGFSETVTFPLEAGRLDLAGVARHLLGELGVAPGVGDVVADMEIAVTSRAARLTLLALELASDGGLRFEVKADRLEVVVDQVRLSRRTRDVQRRIREVVATLYPRMAAGATPGLQVMHETGARPPESGAMAGRVVLLVHGLDSRASIWTSMAIALRHAGFLPVTFSYANDQPIADSSGEFALALRTLRGLGVEHLDIVAHSMGGLVVRDVLTSPGVYDGRAVSQVDLPGVQRFIMIATPNQGAALAWVTVLGDLEEHLLRVCSGNGFWAPAVLDGMGEARVDLRPGSRYLEALHARPGPTSVRMTIIAGRASPMTAGRLAALVALWKDKAPARWQTSGMAAGDFFGGLTDGVGDGAVSVAATRWNAVDDHVVVEANHISIVKHPGHGGQGPPAAIPIVLERLQRDMPSAVPDRPPSSESPG